VRCVVGVTRSGILRRLSLVVILLAGMTGELHAQNIISVPFTNGFVGTRSSSAGTSNNVLTYATLGIARTFFIQNSSTNAFELQGNDVPGTLRIVRTNGTTLDMPASANWRNSGGTTFLIGILPRPASPITFAYSGGSIQITDGTVSGGSSLGGYVAAYTGAVLTDGSSTSGNAALGQVLDGLNSYLSTVVASRPAGPVTVTTLTTTSTTPTITGTATVGSGEALSVELGGIQYTTSSTPAVTKSGTTWSLALSDPLAVGTYSVTATITNADGFTLSDATSNELVISSPVPPSATVTVTGGFTASDRQYDATTNATGTTSGLTLSGVVAPDQVTIASVTMRFQTAAAGTGKTVVITGVTLGGADAGRYTVSLTAAPTTTANITTRPLAITGVSAANRVYDGTTTATLSGTASYAGLVSGESFVVTGTPAASFTTATVGNGKAVTVTGYTAPSANYTVTQPTGLSANITPKPVTIGGSFTVADKVYDGATTATITANSLTPAGVVAGDTVALAAVTAAFNSATVGAAKPVTLTTASLAGPAAGNYTLNLTGAPTTTANIVAASPPSAPRNVAATPGDASIAVTWVIPETIGCGAISGYVVEYSTDGAQAWTRVTVPTPSPMSVILPTLVNNVAHLVRVAAVNPCGIGAFSASIGPIIPVAPTLDATGQPVANTPGTASNTTGGVSQPVTVDVVRDSTIRVTGGDFTLSLRSSDQLAATIPIDSSRILQLERGGSATADGTGFAPGTFVTTYLLTATGTQELLGTVAVASDGSFTATQLIPATLAVGNYTLQVNGIDQNSKPRSVNLGVEVVLPPPDLVLTATPDQPSPTMGDTITITLTVTNKGRGPAIDVTIPRAFNEPGFSVIQATPQEGTYNADTHQWTISRIEPGAHARMLITAIVLPPAAPPQGSSP